MIRGVKVGPSPAWLADRLTAIGARPINNVVDVTNYVLWETGQPLHAFDLGKIRGGLIRVRRATAGEKLQTLDQELRELSPEVLVIADAEGPVGLGGVMGGFDSETTEATVDILLESAHFRAPVVRRGAKQLGMKTDASHRFERGADPGGSAVAGLRAAALIAELAGGTLAPGVAELYRPLPSWPPKVTLSYRALCRFGGADIPSEEGERILRSLGFRVVRDGDEWAVTAPSWRYYDFQDRLSGRRLRRGAADLGLRAHPLHPAGGRRRGHADVVEPPPDAPPGPGPPGGLRPFRGDHLRLPRPPPRRGLPQPPARQPAARAGQRAFRTATW